MLTVKQEKYVQEIIAGKSQREAYRAAYPSSLKWKDSVVDSKASTLLKNGKVLERYHELQNEVKEKVIYDAATIKNEIIETELAILRADYGKLFDIKAAGKKGLASVPKKDIKGVDMRTVKSYRYDKSGKLIIEFYDKQNAIDTLREMFGIAPEETEDKDINIYIHSKEGYDA